jgi:Ca2+-binding RTX toxin-like protein
MCDEGAKAPRSVAVRRREGSVSCAADEDGGSGAAAPRHARPPSRWPRAACRTVYGGKDFDEVLVNGPGDDIFVMGAARDAMEEGPGNDTHKGGSGNDGFSVFRFAGADIYEGGPGRDRIDVELVRPIEGIEDVLVVFFSGDATLIGDAADNSLQAHGDGDGHIEGRDGDDHLEGGDGSDFLDGGLGLDRLDGRAGIDECINGEVVLNCEA